MRYKIAIIFLMIFSLGFQSKECNDKKKENSMNSAILSVKVICRENEGCLFTGKDIFLDIKIFNNESEEVGFPLEFVKSKGPIVRLMDNRTKKETFLPTHPPDGDLLEKYTNIPPNQSVGLEWVVTAEELQQFGSDVDLLLEVTIMGDILFKGKKLKYIGKGSRQIDSKSPVS